ncbi:hypothetical protein P775_08975 [Puniceibacterium antarcticum]|uniref:Uncharacterized protein n=1 Tax=Puniceibacterium antarcticum TaxID=1206336 RepID=A0A2G8RGI4_9RHOB|nr:hypothetical protein [Puniceibacterium antarcticum]PIL20649.1 hypothetical protein P775_08975 [Puniceibacterium antarcticum]
MTLLSTFQKRIAKRAEGRRTLSELRQMPLYVALDIDIHPADAEKIARRAFNGT